MLLLLILGAAGALYLAPRIHADPVLPERTRPAEAGEGKSPGGTVAGQRSPEDPATAPGPADPNLQVVNKSVPLPPEHVPDHLRDVEMAVFESHVKHYGSEESANQVSAHPGESEHQTGLAMDVSTPEIGFQLTESFAQTKAGRWIAENAARFGFVVRYPKGKEEVTGYQYEPWHLQYVGTVHSAMMANRNVTLEEHLEELRAAPRPLPAPGWA